MPPPPSNSRPHQPPHDLQPHGGFLHDPNPNTLATTSSEHSGEPLQRRVIGYDVSQAIGSHALAPRQPNTQAVVIEESTVVPGATEEQHSGLAFNNGFVVGTRVERVVPGAKEHQSFGLGLIGLPPEPPGVPAGTKLLTSCTPIRPRQSIAA